MFFCNTALTSTGWVRITSLFLTEFFSEEKLGRPKIEPRPVGWEVWPLPLCYDDSPLLQQSCSTEDVLCINYTYNYYETGSLNRFRRKILTIPCFMRGLASFERLVVSSRFILFLLRLYSHSNPSSISKSCTEKNEKKHFWSNIKYRLVSKFASVTWFFL